MCVCAGRSLWGLGGRTCNPINQPLQTLSPALPREAVEGLDGAQNEEGADALREVRAGVGPPAVDDDMVDGARLQGTPSKSIKE